MGSYQVAKITDIPEGVGKAFTLEGTRVAVFNIEGKFLAMDDTCPHKGGSLAEGFTDGTQVTCPWHGWVYDITDGQCQSNPNAKCQTYKVTLDGDQITVEM